MAAFSMKRDNSFTWHRKHTDKNIWTGKRAIIVGGTGGIGRAISRHLATMGAQVTVVGQTFRDAEMPGIAFIASPQRQETAEGIERDLAVSYLNRLVILRVVAERIGSLRPNAKTKPRIFNVAYPGAGQLGNPADFNSNGTYSAMSAHMNTVAANEALVLDAAKRYPHLAVFGLNPGLIKTGIRDNFLGKGSFKSRMMETVIGWLMPTADEYASTLAPLLASPDLESHSGALFNRKGEPIRPSEGMTDGHIARLIKASDDVLATTG
ncbi:SDR family NAD(P)-dependent oxidoreductase [Vogesella indigofera]|uniref:SDR family NAD(P)-dependent oxidoreductase n=1 Tax=Vogesella indigofera TaxID=45465 RepID=A0ABT5I3D6_VOGIN|nr:SDR family NAD(P)-dependent oxidoreductase [Vogesella indigofera]MDC7690697.1 SDR family NAD(P)-dependent oxidoreductase [Vogesella indigofera]